MFNSYMERMRVGMNLDNKDFLKNYEISILLRAVDLAIQAGISPEDFVEMFFPTDK